MNGQPNGSISASGMPSSQTASSASSTAAALKTSSFAAQRDEIDSTRREELLARLDELAEELLYLGVTPEEIARRCQRAAEEGRLRKGKGGDRT